MTISASEFASPVDNKGLQAAAAAALNDVAAVEKPDIASQPIVDYVLPGGYEDENGKILKSVTVRELNGNDEEKITRHSALTTPAKWIQTVLECGVETIGGERATSEMISNLLIGDQDYLLLAIRAATYGTEVEMGTFECPQCKEQYDLSIEVPSDFTMHPLTKERQFEVALKKGRKAIVRIPTGADRAALYEDSTLTAAERKTLMLSRCIEAIEEADGEVSVVTGLADARRLSLADRNSVLEVLDTIQPGPRYNELSHTHECGLETAIGVGLSHLFPGL